MTRREAIAALAALAAIPLVGCGSGDPAIAFDLDSCESCRMTISDRRFGGAARTSGGRIVRFDSIECLVEWLERASAPPAAIWLVDAMVPGALVPLDSAEIRRDGTVRSPMAAPSTRAANGGSFIAVASSHRGTPWGGEIVSWDAVRRELSGTTAGAN